MTFDLPVVSDMFLKTSVYVGISHMTYLPIPYGTALNIKISLFTHVCTISHSANSSINALYYPPRAKSIS